MFLERGFRMVMVMVIENELVAGDVATHIIRKLKGNL